MEQVTGPNNIGSTIEVKCPVGQPPVFIRDHDDMHRVVALLRQKRIVIIKKKEKKKSSPLNTESSTNHTLTPTVDAIDAAITAQTNFIDGVELEGDFFSYCDNLTDERDR